MLVLFSLVPVAIGVWWWDSERMGKDGEGEGEEEVSYQARAPLP